MKKQKLKHELFQERTAGAVIFEIPGKKISYKGVIEQLDAVGTYVPKLYMHEKSGWCLLFVRPWMNRHTLYYGNEMQSKAEAVRFMDNVRNRLVSGGTIDSVVADNFQEALVFLD